MQTHTTTADYLSFSLEVNSVMVPTIPLIKQGDGCHPLLGDLFLTIMESMGVEQERFAKASRNMNDYLL